MKALKIKFELSKEGVYNSEFVEKILQEDKDLEEGKDITVTLEELKRKSLSLEK